MCGACGGPRKVVATIQDEELAEMMPSAMRVEQEVPELARARPPPEPVGWDSQLELDVDDVA